MLPYDFDPNRSNYIRSVIGGDKNLIRYSLKTGLAFMKDKIPNDATSDLAYALEGCILSPPSTRANILD